MDQAELEIGDDASDRLPEWVGAAARRVLAARGRSERLFRAFERSPVPMVLVDDERRYVEVNPPARLVFRLTLDELRRLRIENLTPAEVLPTMMAAWTQLMEKGGVSGDYIVSGLDGGQFRIVYGASANVIPGLHLIAFAPAGWTGGELTEEDANHMAAGLAGLTPRELEVIELASEGLSGPAIAERLVVSPGTVRTHFENIYAKLGVSDRAGAVARAMRLGLIH